MTALRGLFLIVVMFGSIALPGIGWLETGATDAAVWTLAVIAWWASIAVITAASISGSERKGA